MKDLRFDNPAAAECNHRSAPRRPGDCDLPRQIDQPDQPSTLPQAELNPLLNPLLSQNMGRWAEVYFTSPPEKREQAVQELLRELERDCSAGEASAQATAVASEPGNATEASHTFPSAHLPASFPENSAATNPETAAATSRTTFEGSAGL